MPQASGSAKSSCTSCSRFLQSEDGRLTTVGFEPINSASGISVTGRSRPGRRGRSRSAMLSTAVGGRLRPSSDHAAGVNVASRPLPAGREGPLPSKVACVGSPPGPLLRNTQPPANVDHDRAFANLRQASLQGRLNASSSSLSCSSDGSSQGIRAGLVNRLECHGCSVIRSTCGTPASRSPPPLPEYLCPKTFTFALLPCCTSPPGSCFCSHWL